MRPVLLYALHSGNLYGTERMALATMQGLRDQFEPVLLAPPGAAIAEAERIGLQALPFRSLGQFVTALGRILLRARRIAFFGTAVSHSLIFIGLNRFLRRPSIHAHLVHGGTDERLSYGRKSKLNGHPVTLVAVSDFVRERLEAHGVNRRQIRVIENFLPDEQIDAAPHRGPFSSNGIAQVILVSRVDPIKRIDLLLDTLDAHPELRRLDFAVYGTGWDFETLKARALRDHPMVQFLGFSDRIAKAMSRSDLFLHLCPEEPFGLAILEAMAARIPALVPDRGGAGALIEPGISGFHFLADDVHSLAHQLTDLQITPAGDLNRIATVAGDRLLSHYSGSARLADYRSLVQGLLA